MGRKTVHRVQALLFASLIFLATGQPSVVDVKKDVQALAPKHIDNALGSRPQQLLVSLANGQLVALNEDTGDVLWTFDTGVPLLSSANPGAAAAAAGFDDPDIEGDVTAPAVAPKEGIFPSTDGSLYVYRPDDTTGVPRIEKLPVSIRDLVDASPAPAPDGSLVLGSQQTTVYVIDALKGVLLRTLPGVQSMENELLSGDRLLEGALDPDGVPYTDLPQPPSIIAIGRKDYTLRAVHPHFGEQWNVTWSKLQRLSEMEVMHYPAPSGSAVPDASLGGHIGDGTAGTLDDQEQQLGSGLGLVVGPDHSLRRLDSSSGWQQWSQRFDAPPVAAYLPSGGKVDLLESSSKVQQPLPTPSSSSSSDKDDSHNGQAGGNGAPTAQEIKEAEELASAVVVGVMPNAGLYGVPAGRLAFFLPPDPQCTADEAGAAGTTCSHTDVIEDTIHPNSLTHSDTDNNKPKPAKPSSTAVSLKYATVLERARLSLEGVCVTEDPEEEGSPSGTCSVPVGLFATARAGASGLLFLPPSEAEVLETKQAEQGGGRGSSSVLPGFVWLLGSVVLGGATAVVTLRVKMPAAVNRALGINGTSSKSPNKKRKSGKSGSGGKQTNGTTSQSLGTQQQQQQQDDQGIDINNNNNRGRRPAPGGGIIVGRLQVSTDVLGYGSGGTVVFDGELDGRPVAVKRLLRQFVELARKEIQALIVSDEHPNVVRCFAMEEDDEFVYLALEKCAITLADAVANDPKRFVDTQGHPTRLAIQIALDIGYGLTFLHARNIVHRDLKPHNVLLTAATRAKLSDMGLSKRLVNDQASFETAGVGGSPGWQAPEQLIGRGGGTARQTAAVDVFSFGLLVHFLFTGGKHPFGQGFERDANIMKGKFTLSHIAHLREAANVLAGILRFDPDTRPAMSAIMTHPLWWPVPRRLAFLIEVSDRVEGEDRAEDGTMYGALECLLEDAIGDRGSWATAVDSGLVNNLGKYRRYDYSSVRDLLRVIRNKHNHFRELPAELQKKVGAPPDAFFHYFASRFPGLLLSCYYFALRWCALEPSFKAYLPPQATPLLDLLAPAMAKLPSTDIVARMAAQKEKERRERDEAYNASFFAAVAAANDRASGGEWEWAQGAAGSPPKGAWVNAVVGASPGASGPDKGAAGSSSSRDENGVNTTPGRSPGLGPRDQQGAGRDYQDQQQQQQPDVDRPPIALVPHADGLMALFPERPGQPVCDFFQKTGHCRFGEACKFDHPRQYAVKLNRKGLPLRPGEQVCGHYEKHKECKFGPACKFHHPNLPSS